MNREKLERVLCIVIASVLFVFSVLFIALTSSWTNSPEQELKNKVTLNEVGKKLEESVSEESANFPTSLLAPFVDMVQWVDTASAYSINGVPNLLQIYYDTGIKYYNLGFIRADSNKPTESDGTIRWCWGGLYSLSPNGSDKFQYAGIEESIRQIKEAGGDVIVSFGGQLGNSPWTDSQSEEKLAQMYTEVINTYGLKRIDLDIEESNQGTYNNSINARAVKKVQDKTGIEVSLTIPIMPYGWDTTQLNLIRAYINAGVKISVINNMTMCYGYSGVRSGEDFGDASIRALKNAMIQLKQIYAEYNVTITDEEAYKMLGATVDIGYENSDNPTFTADLTQKVAEFCKESGVAMYSFWSMNRDARLESNKGIYYQYGHTTAASYYLDK